MATKKEQSPATRKTDSTSADDAATNTTKPITKTLVMGRNRGAVLRLQQDYINLNKDPVPYIRAEPLPENLLEWHYVISGPENSPYHNGKLHSFIAITTQQVEKFLILDLVVAMLLRNATYLALNTPKVFFLSIR